MLSILFTTYKIKCILLLLTYSLTHWSERKFNKISPHHKLIIFEGLAQSKYKYIFVVLLLEIKR